MPDIERELKNETDDDRAQAIDVVGEDMEQIAERTDAEYVLVRIEPLSKEQHESNQKLRELVAQRSETDQSDTGS